MVNAAKARTAYVTGEGRSGQKSSHSPALAVHICFPFGATSSHVMAFRCSGYAEVDGIFLPFADQHYFASPRAVPRA